ncbi:hypothetical protein [Flagellimonas sp.]|uniref:hypothetical protein n=1 Tax=Flagellimonas sp. TaxID=2058762 RepID=UPI000C0908F6|nr:MULTISPECIES: hypothetical protein [unclassified Allomuricauda]MAU14140.1 hypothetical protein [Allomuricauda sp.]|tara:strand:+ start:979 stop:1473 length:495 start_codon:yes stop_codon:yes gene_type:complete
MIENIKFKEASKREITLYTILGESLCAVQILEDALSHSIVLKKTEPDQKNEADNLLKKQRKYTLGLAINAIKKESLFPKALGFELSNLLTERNWLIHKSITENKDDLKSDSYFEKLIERIKAITSKAHKLQISIELDLIEYSEKKGIDMTKVKNAMNKHYGWSK